MSTKEADKASRYISQLYDARCNSQWANVPELARKVEKHAPNRKCLVFAARAGALVYGRPGMESARQADSMYGEALSTAIREESSHQRDVLDGATCRAMAYYGMGEVEQALTQVPEPLHRLRPPSRGQGEEAWGAVSVVQGTLIRGLSFEAQKNEMGASTTYRSVISYLSIIAALPSLCPALRQSSEELLCHICLYFASGEARPPSLGEGMAAFHVLSSLLRSKSGQFSMHRGPYTRDRPRQLWRVHYRTLSQIVSEGLVYHPSPLERDHETLEHKGLLEDEEYMKARQTQRAELKRVEANYETILLRETSFPKANETNQEVKDWVEMVLSNWRTMCGPSWTDAELGDGGKLAVGRNTLDILYRAQTKTFHSTQILRHLFTIHSYLAEFDLAFKTLDAYIEISTRGKARVAKSGSVGLDLDEDDTMVLLAAEAIRVACRYGSEPAAEKALEISGLIQRWIEQTDPTAPMTPRSHKKSSPSIAKPAEVHFETLKGETLMIAYRAVGISQATWSRCTFDPVYRETLQETALQNFKKSLSQSQSDADCTETLFALSVLLSEMRQIPQATEIVVRAIGCPDKVRSLQIPEGVLSKSATETLLKDAWAVNPSKVLLLRHLLCLLQSANEDYETALLTCEASLKSFSLHPTVQHNVNQLSNPTSNNDIDHTSLEKLTANMDSYDKQNLVELKMTHVALEATIQGPAKAVGGCRELILLLSRLFGTVNVRLMTATTRQSNLTTQAAATSPPKSTRNSIRSMLGRGKTNRKSSQTQNADRSSFTTTNLPSANTSRPTTMTNAPSIHVTGSAENGAPPHPGMHQASLENVRESSELGNSPKSSHPSRKSHFGSLRSKKGRTGHQYPEPIEKPPSIDGLPSAAAEKVGMQAEPDKQLSHIAHNMPHNSAEPPVGHSDQPPTQDTRLPVPPPGFDHSNGPLSPYFVDLQQKRHRTSLLVKVWLFIARLYTIAERFGDARSAVNETYTLVENLEMEVAKEESSVRAFQETGWGGGRSVEDLWGDVYAERGVLEHAQDLPHDALASLDRALFHSVNHPAAIVNISKILLDIHDRIIPSERPDSPPEDSLPPISTQHLPHPVPFPPQPPPQKSSEDAPLRRSNPDPLYLYRLAARDRAYALLSSLVKLGEGHDDSEAWLVLARVCEASGLVEEARKALWRVVRLEDTAAVRGWRGSVAGGFVL